MTLGRGRPSSAWRRLRERATRSRRRILPRADHILHQLLGVRLGGHLLGDLSSAVHDDDPVGDGEGVGQDVGDEDNRRASIPQSPDELQHLVLFRNAEVVGRLVHDHELGVPVDGAGDRHRLALPAGQILDRVGEGRKADLQGVGAS